MNATGYDLATLGNHEFESWVTLDKNLKDANFKMINSNVISKDVYKSLKEKAKTDEGVSTKDFADIDDSKYLCAPNYLYKSPDSDLKIGFFGLLTDEVSPGKHDGTEYKVLKNGLEYEGSKYQVEKLKEQGADIVICLSHLGLEDNQEGNRSIDIYNELCKPGKDKELYPIDLILDGHSHTLITSGGENEPIMSGEMLLRYVGITIVDNESEKIEDSFLITLEDIMENFEPDKETEKVVTDIIKENNPDFFNKSESGSDNGNNDKKSEENESNKKNHNFKYSFG